MRKYVLLFSAFLISILSMSQKYQPNTLYGEDFNRTNAKYALGLPADTFAIDIAFKSYPHLALKGDSLYFWSVVQQKWIFGGGGGAGTANIYNTNGTITSNRTINGNSKSFFWNGSTTWSIWANTIDMLGIANASFRSEDFASGRKGFFQTSSVTGAFFVSGESNFGANYARLSYDGATGVGKHYGTDSFLLDFPKYSIKNLPSAADDTTGKIMIWKDNRWLYLPSWSIFTGIGGGGIALVNKTYSQLTTMIGAGTLVPGMFYKITDFQTVYKYGTVIPDTTAAGEELIVQAVSSTALSSSAISTSYPNDIIKYSVTDGTVLAPTSGSKGVILYREDPVNRLSAYYDWRGIRWRRWALSAGTAYYAFTDGSPSISTTDFLPLPTFSTGDKNCILGRGTYNVVLEDNVTEVTIGNGCGSFGAGIHIIDNSYAIRIDDECATIMTAGSGYVGGIWIGSATRDIHIGSRSYNIQIGSNVYAVDLGLQQSDVFVPDNTMRRRLEKGFSNLEVTTSVSSNTIDLYNITVPVLGSMLYGNANPCGLVYVNGTGTVDLDKLLALTTSVVFHDIRIIPDTGLVLTLRDKVNTVTSGANFDFGGDNITIDGDKREFVQVHKNLINTTGSQQTDFYLTSTNAKGSQTVMSQSPLEFATGSGTGIPDTILFNRDTLNQFYVNSIQLTDTSIGLIKYNGDIDTIKFTLNISGTPDSSKYLAGDFTWKPFPTIGSGGSSDSIQAIADDSLATGNIWLNTTINRIKYKSGSYKYVLAVEDSTFLGSYDSDAIAYWTAEEGAASITIPDASKNNINAFITAAKSGTNYWGNIVGLYMGYGTGLINAKNTSLSGTASTPPTIDGFGYTFLGSSSQSINLGIIPSTHLNSQEFYAMYLKSWTSSAIVGSVESGAGTYIFPTNPSYEWRLSASGDVNAGVQAKPGTFVIWRKSDSFVTLSRNGTDVYDNSLGVTTPSTTPLAFGAFNSSGGPYNPAGFGTGTVGIFIVGKDLTDAQAAQMASDIATFITSESRN